MNGDKIPARDRALADEELRFFGAITASVTHDLNNVISIIDQTSGLIRDMIVAEKSGAPLSVERLSDAIDATEKQSFRALEIIRRLNQFAHSTDEPDVVFDVPEVIENLIEICRRFAALKRAAFELDLPPERTPLRGNPFLFQDAVFRALRTALDTVQSGDVIRVSLESGDAGVSVLVEAPRGVDEDGVAMKSVAFVVREMTGSVELEPKGDGTLMKLAFSKESDGRPV
jgi:signal transduction histidine kinase